jgi:hypothetical protein
MAFAIRIPWSTSLGRLGPSAARAIRSSPVRLHARAETDGEQPAPVRDEDVELAVREHLYGARSSSR